MKNLITYTAALLISATALGQTSNVRRANAASTDNTLIKHDGTGGKTVQDTGIVVDDSDNITGIGSITVTGDTTAENLKLNGSTSGTTTVNATAVAGTTTITIPAATDTLVGKATTDTLTNKTIDANGTGNSISNIDIADLANGTDGELITWDAAGAPAAVAVGTSGHVLTSNGTGAAPTFQAASGGGLGSNLSSSTDDISSDNGTIRLATSGGTNNEDLDFDLETTANTAAISSSTGVTTIDTGTIVIDAASFTDDGVAVPTISSTSTLTNKTLLTGSNTITQFQEKHATSHTLTAAECYGATYYITASGVTLTLPAAADGMSITVICTTANVGIIDSNASDLIILDGTTLDDGDSIDSPGAAGDIVVLTYYDATGWFASSNTWVDGGAS